MPQALRDERQRVVGVAQVNDEADVIGAAVGDVFQRGEQFAVVAIVAFAAIAGGIDAGRAAKRGDAQAGIVGNRRQAALFGGMARLDKGVFHEGQPGFGDFINAVIALWPDGDAEAGKDGGEFGDFFRVVAGEDGVHGLCSSEKTGYRPPLPSASDTVCISEAGNAAMRTTICAGSP